MIDCDANADVEADAPIVVAPYDYEMVAMVDAACLVASWLEEKYVSIDTI